MGPAEKLRRFISPVVVGAALCAGLFVAAQANAQSAAQAATATAPNAASAAVASTLGAGAADDTNALYDTHCGTCHQFDGGGVPFMQPELIGSPRANGPVGGVIEMILLGSKAVDRSDGSVSDFQNTMPPFDYLSDEDIQELASYVRTHFSNTGGPVSLADVQRVRASTGSPN